MQNPVISCSHISYSIGEDKILHDVYFSVQKGEKIALVGSNGVGKSTLLKLIAKDQNDAIGSMKGKIELATKIKIEYFPQETPEKFKEKKVSEYADTITEKDLKTLGLDKTVLSKKISELSGGEKSKINLLRIKNTEADLFLLDEPTNNLDSVALDYLETFISKNKNSTFIIISHDRQLMERFADKIVEINWHTRVSSTYPGPFSKYIELRKQRIENEWKIYNDYLDKKDQLRAALQEKKQWSAEGEKGPKKTDNEKFTAGNAKDWSGKVLGKSVKTAQKKLDELEIVEKPKETLTISYPISLEERSGDMVCSLKNVIKTMGIKEIGPIKLDVQFGDKLIILGNNGSGKTTLLKMIMVKINPDSGEIRLGSHIKIGYLPQESEISDEMVLDIIKKQKPKDETDFRKLLNNFGITKVEMKKSGNTLSPGEKSRFVLASIITQKPNLLILDEPTNHLDIFALDFLEEAIRNYKGTCIIVTHDRYFLTKIEEYKVFDMESAS